MEKQNNKMKVKKIIILKYVNFILNLTDWVNKIIC